MKSLIGMLLCLQDSMLIVIIRCSASTYSTPAAANTGDDNQPEYSQRRHQHQWCRCQHRQFRNQRQRPHKHDRPVHWPDDECDHRSNNRLLTLRYTYQPDQLWTGQAATTAAANHHVSCCGCHHHKVVGVGTVAAAGPAAADTNFNQHSGNSADQI